MAEPPTMAINDGVVVYSALHAASTCPLLAAVLPMQLGQHATAHRRASAGITTVVNVVNVLSVNKLFAGHCVHEWLPPTCKLVDPLVQGLLQVGY